MSNINVVQNLTETVKGNQKISRQSKFEVSNSKIKKSGQQCTFQKVWKILLLTSSNAPKTYKNINSANALKTPKTHEMTLNTMQYVLCTYDAI